MGYTHYYERPTTLPVAPFRAFVQDVRTLVQEAQRFGIGIHGWDGTNRPQLTNTLVSLNGSEVNDQDHETFAIPRVYKRQDWERPLKRGELRYGFCKTARKPYDAVVGAALISLVHHMGTLVRVRSDGRFQDWVEPMPGVRGPLTLYRRVFPDRNLPGGDYPWNE